MTSRSDRPSPGTEPQTALSLYSEQLLSAFDIGAVDYSELSARLWMVERDVAREARAALLAEVREGVEGLRVDTGPFVYPADETVAFARAVLALLDTLSDGGPTDG